MRRKYFRKSLSHLSLEFFPFAAFFNIDSHSSPKKEQFHTGATFFESTKNFAKSLRDLASIDKLSKFFSATNVRESDSIPQPAEIIFSNVFTLHLKIGSSDPPLGAADVSYLNNKLPSLQSVSVDQAPTYYPPTHGEMMQSLSKIAKLKSLQTCIETEEESWQSISQMSELTSINFHCPNTTTGAPFHHLSSLTNLRILTVEAAFQFSDRVMTSLSSLSGLTTLRVVGSQFLGDEGANVIAASFPLLKVLSLRSNTQITNEGFRALWNSLPSLEDVDVSYCQQFSDAGLENLARSCPRMTKLNCSTNLLLSDLGMKYISQCSQITDLDVSGSGRITEQGVRELATGLNKLKTLSLWYCAALKFYSALPPMHSLEHLNLGNCSQIDDESLQRIISAAPHCKTLSLNFCTLITAEGFKKLAQLSNTLEGLDCDGIEKIDDESLRFVLMRARRLKRLDLKNANVWDQCFEDEAFLRNHLSRLMYFSVRVNFSETIALIEKCCPHLELSYAKGLLISNSSSQPQRSEKPKAEQCVTQ